MSLRFRVASLSSPSGCNFGPNSKHWSVTRSGILTLLSHMYLVAKATSYGNETPHRKSCGQVSLAGLTKLLAKFRVWRPTKLSSFFRPPPPAHEKLQFFPKESVFLCCANWVSWGLSFVVMFAVQQKSWPDQVSLRSFVPIRSGLTTKPRVR